MAIIDTGELVCLNIHYGYGEYGDRRVDECRQKYESENLVNWPIGQLVPLVTNSALSVSSAEDGSHMLHHIPSETTLNTSWKKNILAADISKDIAEDGRRVGAILTFAFLSTFIIHLPICPHTPHTHSVLELLPSHNTNSTSFTTISTICQSTVL